MFAAELAYRGWVAVNGYRWLRYKELPESKGCGVGGLPASYLANYSGMVLTEVHDHRDNQIPRQYRPCEPFNDHPTLYREFAEIGWGDVEAIKSFASRYGMLDSQEMLCVHAFPLPTGVHVRRRQNMIPCDPEEDWLEGPALFRAMIRAWEGSQEQLREMFRWEPNESGGMWVWHPTPSDGPARSKEEPRGLLVRVVYREWSRQETIVQAGAVTPDYPVSNSLLRWDGPGVDPITDVAKAFIRQEIAKGLHSVKYEVTRDAKRNGLFQISPSNLLGALYLQLDYSVTAGKEHRHCRQCGKWFELVPKDRGRKEFCNDACKVKDLRERRKQATALRESGRELEQIAEAIKTPLETIRRWVQDIKPAKQKESK